MADSAIRPEDLEVQSVKDGIAALAQLGVTVVRTERPIVLDYSNRADDGGVLAGVCRVTLSPTDHVFIELFDVDDYLTCWVLSYAESLISDGLPDKTSWLQGLHLTRQYADRWLAAKVFREQLDDTPHRCRTCGGRMSKARYGAWQHAKCEPVPTSLAAVAERKARRQLFTDATKAGA